MTVETGLFGSGETLVLFGAGAGTPPQLEFNPIFTFPPPSHATCDYHSLTNSAPWTKPNNFLSSCNFEPFRLSVRESLLFPD